MANTTMLGSTRAGGQAHAGEIIKAGTIAGLIGGILMAMYAMFSAAIQGMGFLSPLKMIGATFVGPPAMTGGVGVLLWGMMLHMMVSAMWGVLFAGILSRGTRGGTALLAGVAYAFAILVVMTWIVVPIINPVMHARIPMMWGSWIIEHVLFGIGVSLAPYFRRRVSPELQPSGSQLAS